MNKHQPFSTTLVATAVLLGSLLLGGCGGGGGGGETASTNTNTTTTNSTPPPSLPPPAPQKSKSLQSGGVLESKVISYDSYNATIELGIIVVDSKSNILTNISSSNFSIKGFTKNDVTISFDPVQTRLASMTYAGPYSAFLLMDQSGSITSTDPNDSRIDAGKIFLDNLGTNDNVRLAAFASNGKLPFSPLTVYGNGFTYDGSSLVTSLESLAKLESGGTPLYDSTIAITRKTAVEAPNSNKAVIVFTDGEDTSSTNSIDQVISTAKTNGVKVFTVGLSSGVNTQVLSKLAGQTGGSFIQASDARQLVSWYGTLGKILNGSAKFYKTQWTMRNDKGKFGAGGWVESSMKITTSEGTLYVPFVIHF